MPSKNMTFDTALARLNDYIERHQLRPSLERTTILRYICDETDSFTASSLFRKVMGEHVSRATVYNTLQLLVLARVLYCHRDGKSSSQVIYELATDSPNQIQLVCTRCGRVAKLRDNVVKDILMSKSYSNFRLHHFSLFLYGECKTCKKQTKKP